MPTHKTALMKVKNDLLMNMDKCHVTFLASLDLIAALDMVDHDNLLKRLQSLLPLGSNCTFLVSILSGG